MPNETHTGASFVQPATTSAALTAPVTPEVTSPSEWRRSPSAGVVVELPSGRTARLRRTMSLLNIIKTGRVPNPLSGMINEMMSGKRNDIPLKELDKEQLSAMIELVDQAIPDIFIEPRVQAAPAEYARPWYPPQDAPFLSVDEIDLQDRFFAFAFAQGGPADVKSFRQQSEQIVATVEDGSGVPGETERPAGAE